MGAAVHPIFTAGSLEESQASATWAPVPPHHLALPAQQWPYLGHGAAPPGAIEHMAACR